jgi:PadR family transcriptional regulator, regulatory protein PadR
MYGQQLATEIGKRKGDKPNPGPVYPALKELASLGLIRGIWKAETRCTI